MILPCFTCYWHLILIPFLNGLGYEREGSSTHRVSENARYDSELPGIGFTRMRSQIKREKDQKWLVCDFFSILGDNQQSIRLAHINADVGFNTRKIGRNNHTSNVDNFG